MEPRDRKRETPRARQAETAIEGRGAEEDEEGDENREKGNRNSAEDREETHAARQDRGAVTAGVLTARRWLAVILCCGVLTGACVRRPPAVALTDQEFWALIQTLSEPPGTFTISDNLVSNEPHVAENARRLQPAGGVYIGVGPEQNFSYIARLRPAMAFIVDIRRENRNLHLFYKALFELSADRADFVARLFSRPRPGGLGATSSVTEIFERFESVTPSPEQLRWNADRVREWLVETRRLPLEQGDLEWIEQTFKVFAAEGPEIHFWRSADVNALKPSYRRLMTLPDATGESRSFLATEEGFWFVKDLQARNLIVPLVGDFAGPLTLRRVGDDVRARGYVVRAFYGSNVGGLPDQPADPGVLPEPRRAAVGGRRLVHRTGWHPTGCLQTEDVRSGAVS